MFLVLMLVFIVKVIGILIDFRFNIQSPVYIFLLAFGGVSLQDLLPDTSDMLD